MKVLATGKISTRLASCVALALCSAMIETTVGCSAAAQQTTVQVVTKINAELPTVVSAADTVAATVAALAPADAALIAVCDTGFDTVAKTLQALTASYIANPSASVLAQIQSAIATLETSINTATLNAVGITDAASQRLALASLKALLTAVTVVASLIAATESVAQLQQLRDSGVRLARLRPYMDEGELEAAAVRDYGAPKALARQYVNAGFELASAQGF